MGNAGRSLCHCLAALAVVAASAKANENWLAHGRILDEQGQPAAGATVGYFWGANGTGKRPDGTDLDVSKPDEQREIWAHEGDMQPRGKSAVTDEEGRFQLTVPRRYHILMAMDGQRKQGGLLRLVKGQEQSPVEIRMQPLVRLHGRFVAAGQQPAAAWTHVYIHVPEDTTRPTDTFRIAHCGSFQSRFEVWLPPGKYQVEGYGQSNESGDIIDIDARPIRSVALNAGASEMDLGELPLTRRELDNREKWMLEAKRSGTWGDYKKHYGQAPPKWNIVDARGVSKDIQLSDYRGKWVLLYLWGPPCPGCLLDGIPKLMNFYDKHAGQHDRFEILAFCTDCDNNIRSIAELDKFLEPVVKEVWNGRTLPFPVLLDPTFETMRNYGVLGYGTLLLIDPEGNLIEGDEQTLAHHLSNSPSRPAEHTDGALKK